MVVDSTEFNSSQSEKRQLLSFGIHLFVLFFPISNVSFHVRMSNTLCKICVYKARPCDWECPRGSIVLWSSSRALSSSGHAISGTTTAPLESSCSTTLAQSMSGSWRSYRSRKTKKKKNNMSRLLLKYCTAVCISFIKINNCSIKLNLFILNIEIQTTGSWTVAKDFKHVMPLTHCNQQRHHGLLVKMICTIYTNHDKLIIRHNNQRCFWY